VNDVMVLTIWFDYVVDDVTVPIEGVCYRRPDVYNSLFQSVSVPVEEVNDVYGFELEFSKSVQTFVKVSVMVHILCFVMLSDVFTFVI
jgi:hypothetical protein